MENLKSHHIILISAIMGAFVAGLVLMSVATNNIYLLLAGLFIPVLFGAVVYLITFKK